MIYEFRLYYVAHGRTDAEVARMLDVSVLGAPEVCNGQPVHKQTLFERYGVAKPLAAWVAVTGEGLPIFLYIQGWESLRQRDACFPKFWVDPFFKALREEGENGSPLVENVDDWLMTPAAAWACVREPEAHGAVNGLQELVIQRAETGATQKVDEALAQLILPLLKSAGATVLGVFEVQVGSGLPAFIYFLSWHDFQEQQQGWSMLDADQRLLDMNKEDLQRYGCSRFRALKRYLLEPVSWGIPQANFGVPH